MRERERNPQFFLIGIPYLFCQHEKYSLIRKKSGWQKLYYSDMNEVKLRVLPLMAAI